MGRNAIVSARIGKIMVQNMLKIRNKFVPWKKLAENEWSSTLTFESIGYEERGDLSAWE
jgi:hypothetical protein